MRGGGAWEQPWDKLSPESFCCVAAAVITAPLCCPSNHQLNQTDWKLLNRTYISKNSLWRKQRTAIYHRVVERCDGMEYCSPSLKGDQLVLTLVLVGSRTVVHLSGNGSQL